MKITDQRFFGLKSHLARMSTSGNMSFLSVIHRKYAYNMQEMLLLVNFKKKAKLNVLISSADLYQYRSQSEWK